jgi:P27 family predicted phage terminase small subunit
MAGRNRVPNEVKKLRGTFRNDRAHEEVSTQRPAKVPSPPAGMSEPEKKVWRELARTLHEMGVLAKSDLYQLKMLVEAMVFLQVCKNDISTNGLKLELEDQHGNNKIITNPATVAYQQQTKTVNAMMQQFGLTPVSRTKASSTGEQAKKDPILGLIKPSKRVANDD